MGNTTKIMLNMDLPVSQKATHIIDAIRKHQVVIVAGETGSGKTTQLPKLALLAGRGQMGQIGHTQPRRIAARAVASRIAEELGQSVGQTVGFKVRFTDNTSAKSVIKLMTDGVLLAELASDRNLSRYDTIIIDEAHERSLNIDFLLGIIKKLLKKRHDLKLIITSATLDTARFSEYFTDAPIINVEGRSYPIQTLYRPIYDNAKNIIGSDDDDYDDLQDELPKALANAIDECISDARQKRHRGDILVFCATEAQIMELKDALAPRFALEFLTLFGRQSFAEQAKIFTQSTQQRVILSTNVAETALTVPNIRYVIDIGFARIARYNHKARISRLPIEAISQAAANQRRGRCGRIGDGVCIRLYSEDDFLARPEFSEPEILRSNLAQVILQMSALKLGAVQDFDFITKPDSRLIKDGYQLLGELGALDKNTLTPIGRQMARLPIDPRLARILIAAKSYDCMDEALVIVAALAVADVRERPFDKQAQADQKHAVFVDKSSDFVFYINLWQALPKGSNAQKTFAKKHFLNHVRVREWQKTHAQLLQMTAKLKVVANPSVPDILKNIVRKQKNNEQIAYPNLHRALLTGFLSFIAKKDDKEYMMAKNQMAQIFPASALKKSRPEWLFCSEVVQTSRVFLRQCAKVLPEWVLIHGAPLLKYHFYEPHFSKKTGRVHGYVQISLYGLIIIKDALVNYDAIDMQLARKIFIQDALVANNVHIKLEFLHKNAQVLQMAHRLEDKARRRDLVVSESDLFAFYDARLPSRITSQKALADYVALHGDNDLCWSESDILLQNSQDDYPSHIRLGNNDFAVRYIFDPTDDDDGANIKIPATLLSNIDANILPFAIKARLPELVEALLKTLPKDIRKSLQPMAERALNIANSLDNDTALIPSIVKMLRTQGILVSSTDFDWGGVPKHLLINVHIVDERGKVIAKGRDFNYLQEKYAPSEAIAQKGDIDDFPIDFVFHHHQNNQGKSVLGYQALQKNGTGFVLAIFYDKDKALQAQKIATLILSKKSLGAKIRQAQKNIDNALNLAFLPYGDKARLQHIVVDGALECAWHMHNLSAPTTHSQFLACKAILEREFLSAFNVAYPIIRQIYMQAQEIRQKIMLLNSDIYQESIDDITDQLHDLYLGDFVYRYDFGIWREYGRYLQALDIRIDKLAHALQQDLTALYQLDEHMERIAQGAPMGKAEQFWAYRWLVEEWRIALFAQGQKTKERVSDKRLARAWDLVARQ